MMYGRAAELVLTLGLSLGAAFLLRLLRKTLSSGRFWQRAASSIAILAAIPAAGALLCFYIYDRFYFDNLAVSRLAAILALVLSGLAVGILAEGKRARSKENADEDPTC